MGLFSVSTQGCLNGIQCQFVPPYIESKIEAADPELLSKRFRIKRAQSTAFHHLQREEMNSRVQPSLAVDDLIQIYTAKTKEQLPGYISKTKKISHSNDSSVLRAWDSVHDTLEVYKNTFNRNSFDDRGADVKATVHYGNKYSNAFWEGSQIVMGDGDGKIFADFTLDKDVMYHELTHAVVQYTTSFVYEGESGAINESYADIFASAIKQKMLGQTAAEADWLIGDKVLIGKGALRSMGPGKGYVNNPYIGDDPQPKTMDGAPRFGPDDDNGGVHILSGPLNHAFYILSTELGGYSWEKPRQIFYDALTSGQLNPHAQFSDLRKATLSSAVKLFGKESLEDKVLKKAWDSVGIRG